MTDVAAVRRASAEDATAVARLLHDFQIEFDEPTPEVEVLVERYRSLLGGGGAIVLLAGAGPDGFAQLRLRASVLTGALDAYLEELYIVPPKRGRGLGRALLEAAMETARGEGADHMDIAVDESDGPARALYESAGFTNREQRPDGGLMFLYEREL